MIIGLENAKKLLKYAEHDVKQTTYDFSLLYLKAGVGYKRKNKPQFWHFLFGTQAVKISRSS